MLFQGATRLAALITVVIAGSLAAGAQALVVGGEEIADARLMEAARKEGKVVLYGVYPDTGMDIIRGAFTKATGLATDYIRLTTQRLHPRVVSEQAAGKLEADFIDMSDLTLVSDLVDRGILNRPHKVPTFDKIPAALKDAQGRWYTYLRPCSMMSVNTAKVKEADFPTSWFDALDPKWQGRIGMPSIDAGGSSFSNYMFLRDRIAADYWTRLAVQKPRIYPSVIPTATDLVRGETHLMIGGGEPLYEQIAGGAPVRIIFPKEGIACFPDSGGITTAARRPNAAAIWLNFVLSRHGGDIISTTGAFASHPDAKSPEPAGVKFPPQSQVWNIELGQWLTKRDRYSTEWRAAFGVK